jgi:hypothetical protein
LEDRNSDLLREPVCRESPPAGRRRTRTFAESAFELTSSFPVGILRSWLSGDSSAISTGLRRAYTAVAVALRIRRHEALSSRVRFGQQAAPTSRATGGSAQRIVSHWDAETGKGQIIAALPDTDAIGRMSVSRDGHSIIYDRLKATLELIMIETFG